MLARSVPSLYVVGLPYCTFPPGALLVFSLRCETRGAGRLPTGRHLVSITRPFADFSGSKTCGLPYYSVPYGVQHNETTISTSSELAGFRRLLHYIFPRIIGLCGTTGSLLYLGRFCNFFFFFSGQTTVRLGAGLAAEWQGHH